MRNDRREFLKLSGLTATGIAANSLKGFSSEKNSIANPFADHGKGKQIFNMADYAAPKIETVRIGYIGLGNRGSEAVPRIIHIEGIDVRAICDIKPERVNLVLDSVKGTAHHPVTYSGDENIWKKLCERDDVDLVYIATPWAWHTPMAVYAMNHGKHVAVEVPAAQTIDQCWELVETSEKTKRHCMMLENECFDFFELLTLNMMRQGFFGEIVHGEGAYIHNIGRSLFDRVQRPGSWRLNENSHRNGNLYPTHGLGPVCQIMDVNRGDNLDFMVSVSSADFSLNEIAKELAAQDPSYRKYVNMPFEGNMSTSIIKTLKGKTIMLQHDISTMRPKSSRYLVSGTKAVAQCDAAPPKIAISHDGWLSEEMFKTLEEKYTLPFVKKIGPFAREIGGHEGMDVLMDWRLIDCLRNGLPLDYNVYDAALWSSVVPLSEWCVANQSKPVKFPDFTRGSWKRNQPIVMSVDHGTLTGIK